VVVGPGTALGAGVCDHRDFLCVRDRGVGLGMATGNSSVDARESMIEEKPNSLIQDLVDALSDDESFEEPSKPKFPMTVNAIEYTDKEPYSVRGLFVKCGDFVSVRPCDPKFENKTFLGIMIGDLALGLGYSFNPDTGVLKILRHMDNPMIFIPDVNEVVFGCGSWWGRIRKPEDLQQITDADIDNIWYVKALKKLTEGQ
jgi:hypothetical protein